MQYQTIVLGLGAMGSAAAYQLAKRGQRVLGLDQFVPPHAQGSSHGETRVTRQAIGEGEQYTPLSLRSIENAKRICEEHLADRYQLEVIDIRQQPQLAKGVQITAAPTLIREMPLPLRRVVGDLSDTQHVLLGLDLKRRR